MNRRAKPTRKRTMKRSETGAMTRVDALAWRRRWRLVNAAEIAELRATPPQKRFDQMMAISELLRGLGRLRADAAEEESARTRWMKLKEAFLGRTTHA